jgi:hypothetical protein
MYTIFIGLRLNQMGLHRGKKRLAFGQSQPDRLWSPRICRPAAGDHFVRLNAPVTQSRNTIWLA